MTNIEVAEELRKAHKPELAKQPGMVWQIWEDGELTLQKSGELLWQRNLHCIECGLAKSLPIELMPVKETKHGYAFIDSEETGKRLRALIAQL